MTAGNEQIKNEIDSLAIREKRGNGQLIIVTDNVVPFPLA